MKSKLDKDINRTRQELVENKIVDLKILREMVTFYCKRNNINY